MHIFTTEIRYPLLEMEGEWFQKVDEREDSKSSGRESQPTIIRDFLRRGLMSRRRFPIIVFFDFFWKSLIVP